MAGFLLHSIFCLMPHVKYQAAISVVTIKLYSITEKCTSNIQNKYLSSEFTSSESQMVHVITTMNSAEC